MIMTTKYTTIITQKVSMVIKTETTIIGILLQLKEKLIISTLAVISFAYILNTTITIILPKITRKAMTSIDKIETFLNVSKLVKIYLKL